MSLRNRTRPRSLDVFHPKFSEGGGKGSGFDSDGCAAPPFSSVVLAVGVVIDMVGQTDYLVVLSLRLVNVVLFEDFSRGDLVRNVFMAQREDAEGVQVGGDSNRG